MPAGRVEAGETLIQAVEREVLEETGYTCEVRRRFRYPDTQYGQCTLERTFQVEELLAMQVQGSGWYRFAFVAHVTGYNYFALLPTCAESGCDGVSFEEEN